MRDLFQGNEAGAFGGVQPFQSGGDEDTVLAGEWDEIGNRPQRDKVEQRAQIVISRDGKIHLAPTFDERVSELEGEADGT